MSGSIKKHQHDSRLIELNRLLKNGEPNISRMKELYHAISPKHLSPINLKSYTEIGDYLNRRLTGMGHVEAYIGSNLRLADVETCHKVGTKAAKRSTLTRLKDKVAAKEIEEILKQTLEEVKADGIAEEHFMEFFQQMIKAQGFRPEFMRSFQKASGNLKLADKASSSGGGAGIADEK